MNLMEKTEEALEYDLCDHCLGRLFAQLGHGLSNDERGKGLRVFYAMNRSGDERTEVPILDSECEVCSGLFQEVDKFVDIILEELDHIEFETFLVGSRIDPAIEEREEQIWAEMDISSAEPIKTEVNREVGKRVFDQIESEVDLEKPDVKAIIDTRFDTVETEIAPFFIYGRYRKLSREIPQTKWLCKKCRGDGCDYCGGTGKMYENSVEEVIGEPLKEMAFGEDYTLHGMGREDIDAKMLGDGRPFVIEITNPMERDIDLQELEETVEKSGIVEVKDLKNSDRDKVVEIKQAKAEKSYRVYIDIDGDIDRGKLKKVVHTLKATQLSQKTPQRVSHRRADKVRKRTVKDIELERLDENEAVLNLRCEAGTYVKEFIHGDEGRTEPNLADHLGVEISIDKLDVIEVHY